MSPTLIARLVIALGPAALGLIQDLIAVWSKPALTPAEVTAMCAKAQKSYDAYIAEAKAALNPAPTPTTTPTTPTA